MKLLMTLLVASVGFAGVVASRDEGSRMSEHCAAVARGVDDPPPVDCPFCGGNPNAHMRTVRWMVESQALCLLASGVAR